MIVFSICAPAFSAVDITLSTILGLPLQKLATAFNASALMIDSEPPAIRLLYFMYSVVSSADNPWKL